MKTNSNHNSIDIDDYFQQGQSCKFLVRLRGQDSSYHEVALHNNTKRLHQQTLSKSPDRLFYPSTNSKQKKHPKQSLLINTSLNQTAKYSVFTTNPPSNTLIVTSRPISGKLIDMAYKTSNDLYEFSQSILKESSLLVYDKVYNESSTINAIYSEYFQEKVNDLFQGKDSAALFFGPKEGGKSYTLRGGTTECEPGLLNKIIEGIFNLIEVSKQSYINDLNNQLMKSFVVKIQVYQVYQERVSDLIGIEGRMLEEKEIRNQKEYNELLKLSIENRKILAQKLKVNELKRKSSLVIKIHLEKRSREDNRINVFKYAQMTLVELPSSNYALMLSNEEESKIENDPSPSGVFYRNTKGLLMNIRDALTAASNGVIPSINCKLLETMSEIFNRKTNYIIFTCVDPFESSLKHSMKALKFSNRLRHLVLNTGENANGNYNSNDLGNENHYDNSDDEYNNILQQQHQQQRNINSSNTGKKIINPNASMPFTQINQSQSVNNSPSIRDSNPNMNSNTSPILHQRNQSLIVDQQKVGNTHSLDITRSPCQSQKDLLIQKYQHLIDPRQNQTYSNICNDNINRNINMQQPSNLSNRMKTNQSTDQQVLQDDYIDNRNQTNQYANNQSIGQSQLKKNTNTINQDLNQNQSQAQLQNDYSTLISDNIILKEDIHRLSSMNNRMAEELEMERRHRAQLENRIQQLQKEKEMFESDLNQMIKRQNDQLEEEESEDIYTKMNTRLIQERKIRKLVNDNSAFKLSHDKLETENKILTEQLNELKANYNRSNDEQTLERLSHNKEIEQIEVKIEAMTNELYNLQSENKYLRTSEEKTRYELDKALCDRDSYKEKYLKHRERNMGLENQLKINESQIQTFTIESKLKQTMQEESQKIKYDTKTKIVSDLKSKIDNFRSLTYKNRSNESIDKQSPG